MATATITDRIFNLTKVTALTGGTANALDHITTVGYTGLRAVYWNESSDEISFYRLKAGTAAESSPGIILPDDYNASTNAKHWQRMTAVP